MKAGAATRREAQVHLGTSDAAIGTLVYVKQGRRENTAFAYSEGWLASPDRFAVSPELSLTAGYRTRKAASPHDSVFHGAIADTAPDAWGRRVNARDHAKRRRRGTPLEPLTELDYLLAVDDFSRVGALRFSVADQPYSRTVEEGRRRTPPLVALRRVYEASRAVELGQESAADLRYLQGKGTSPGGMRPKCTVLDEDGRLAIGKFPSVGDTRAVTRGEVLALRLARRAGIDAAEARIVDLEGVPVAVIQRFDRDVAHARIPYISAATLLEASREEERAYTEIADALRAHGREPKRDVQQLFRCRRRTVPSRTWVCSWAEGRTSLCPKVRRAPCWPRFTGRCWRGERWPRAPRWDCRATSSWTSPPPSSTSRWKPRGRGWRARTDSAPREQQSVGSHRHRGPAFARVSRATPSE